MQLAEPDEYDAKYKKWRMADLPIVPDRFKLVVRDERSRKQMTVITRMLKRDDVSDVINACDAGREGELIFAWTFEKAGAKKPVQRLWLSSMTSKAIKDAFASLRPASEFALLEEAARSRSEADWIVGMNATRAATIRLRSSFDGAVSLGRVQTPTLAIIARREEEIRAFVPEPYWLVDATFETVDDPRRYTGRFHAGAQPRLKTAEEAEAIVAAVQGGRGTITKLEKTKRSEKAPLLYDLTSLQREANTRFGFSARRTLSAAQRCYEEHKVLTYPRTNSRFLPTDMIPEIKPIAGLLGTHREYARASAYVTGLDVLPLGSRDQRREGHRPPRDHPDELRAQAGQAQRRRPPDLRHGHAALPRGLPSRRGVREHAPGDRRSPSTSSAPAAACCSSPAGAASTARAWRSAAATTTRRPTSSSRSWSRASSPTCARSAPRRRSRSRRGATRDASLLGAMETAGKLVDDDERCARP